MIDQRDANPCKEGNARGKKMQVGKPWVRILQPAKDFFLQNLRYKCPRPISITGRKSGAQLFVSPGNPLLPLKLKKIN